MPNCKFNMYGVPMTQQTPKRFTQAIEGGWRHIFLPNQNVTEALAPPDISGGVMDMALWEIVAESANHSGEICWAGNYFTVEQTESMIHVVRSLQLPEGTQLWVNGKPMAAALSGDGYWEYDISSAVQTDKNEIFFLIPCGGDSVPLFGFWRPVQVELFARPSIGIILLAVESNVRKKQVQVRYSANGPGEIHIRVPGTGIDHKETIVEGEGVGIINLNAETLELWSPQSPRLYTLEVGYWRDNCELECVSLDFGVRDFTIKDHRFYLNGRPYYLKGVRVNCTRALMALETLEQAITNAKEAGFNFLWFDEGPVPQEWLLLCDRLGLPCSVGLATEETGYTKLCQHHVSLCAWHYPPTEPRNEENIYEITDTSRLHLYFDGQNFADRQLTGFVRPYKSTFEPMDVLHVSPLSPVDLEAESYLRHVGEPSRMTMVYGITLPEIEDADLLARGVYGTGFPVATCGVLNEYLETAHRGFAEQELDRGYTNFDAICKQSRGLQAETARNIIDSIRCNSTISGYSFGQLCDTVEGAGGGILKSDGTPKVVTQTLGKVQSVLRPVIQLSQGTLVVRQESPVTVALLNEGRIEGRAELSLQVVGPTNQVLWKKRRQIKIPRHGKELWQGVIAASGSVGLHKFVVRLILGREVIAEAVRAIQVLEEEVPLTTPVHLFDPQNKWIEKCSGLLTLETYTAPVIIVPPYSSTIRAYPDNDFVQILAQVYGGAIAILFSPPDDWNDLRALLPELPEITALKPQSGGRSSVYLTKIHPVFGNLPTKTIMRQAYAAIISDTAYAETSEEIICGFFQGLGGKTLDENAKWGNAILVKRYGAGRIVFTHLRIMESLEVDPLSRRLFENMITHFERRSVPSKAPVFPPQAPIEWLRRERISRVWKWMVVGPYPNDYDQTGHDKIYSPEEKIDFVSPCIGWYRVQHWQMCHTWANPIHTLDFHRLCNPVSVGETGDDYGVYYAYAEFTGDKRQELVLHLAHSGWVKVWLNEHLCEELKCEGTSVLRFGIRQGRNTISLKLSKRPGPAVLNLELLTPKEEQPKIQWWK